MKKLGAGLLVLTTCGALVACNSGGDGLSLSISPSTCSITNGPQINFSYSGLAMNESVFFNFTNPAGAIYLSKNCIVGDGSCFFDGDSGSFSMACQEIAKNGGVGKYLYPLNI